MTAERKFLTIVVGVITAAIATIVLCGLRTPMTVRVAPAVCLAALIVSLLVGGRREPELAAQASEANTICDFTASLDQDHYREKPVREVPLSSAAPDYKFQFSATVHWRLTRTGPGATLANPSARAVDAIVDRAREVTSGEPPNDFGLLQHRLEAALAVALPDESGQVEAWANSVTLALPEVDRHRLSRLAGIRKDEEVWEHERNFERNKRAYLGDDVLKDTGSAVVWWLAKNDDEIERTVDLIGLLARLSAAANNSEVPELFRDLLASPGDMFDKEGSDAYSSSFGPRPFDATSAFDSATFGGQAAEETLGEKLEKFMDEANVDETERPLVARHVATIMTRFGRHEEAARIRRCYEQHDPDTPEQPGDSDESQPPGVPEEPDEPDAS